MLSRFWRDNRAATAIEYCLIAGFISILIVTGALSIWTKLNAKYYGKVGAGLN